MKYLQKLKDFKKIKVKKKTKNPNYLEVSLKLEELRTLETRNGKISDEPKQRVLEVREKTQLLRFERKEF